MKGLSLALFLVLTVIACVHVYWGLGGHWPGTDEKSLARTVVGAAGIERMPTMFACFIVAAALMAAAGWTLMLSRTIDVGFPRWFVLLGGAALVAVFVGRGVVAYLPFWRKLTPELPFAQLDQVFFGPLCLAIGLGVLTLMFTRPQA